MENTLENKAKFFAQYLDQEVYCIEGWNRGVMICDAHKLVKEEFNYLKKSFLILKPLSSISDEDFNEVMCLIFAFQPRASFKKSGFYTDHLNINQADYLRSKGYALPWMGLSVESLIEYGWVKLKEPNNA